MSPLAGIKELAVGPTGTGKTTATATMVEAGVETFVLFTEGGLSTLLGYWTDRGKEVPSNLHWNLIETAPMSFLEIAQQAQELNTLTYEMLCKKQDPNRSHHNQFEKFLRILADFPDERTGKHFGAADSWGTGACLAIDSLSGLNPIALSLVVGSKTTLDKHHYQQAQKILEVTLRKVCSPSFRAHFILTAHPDRQADELIGGSKLYPQVPGKALAPSLGPMFDDVLYSTREGSNFIWTADNPQIDLKARHFPITGKFPQDYRQALQKWKQRGGILEPFVIPS